MVGAGVGASRGDCSRTIRNLAMVVLELLLR